MQQLKKWMIVFVLLFFCPATGLLAGEAPKAAPVEKPAPEADWRWIIKQPPKETKRKPPEKVTIQWASDRQKEICTAYLKTMDESFVKARDFSIQGDPCETARHAKVFLETSEKCRGDCPPQYLEQMGYTAVMLTNAERLRDVGTQRCLRGGK